MWYTHAWQWAKAHLTVTVPGAVLVFAATWVLMLAIQSGASGAAWVQAVGSVAAIFISVWIAQAADRRTERARRERDRVQLQIIARVVEAVQADIAGLKSSLDYLVERKEWEQAHIVLLSTLDMLNAVDLVQFGSGDDVRSFFYIRNTTRRVLHFVHILLREPDNCGAAESLKLNCQLVWDSARLLLNSINDRAA